MPKHNAANERIKQDYFDYLREAKRLGPNSVDAAAKAISRFEESTGWKDFRVFHIKQAMAFKDRLRKQGSQRSGAPLSKATLNSTLRALRAFMLWLADRPGFRSRIHYSDAEYFNLSEKEARLARAPREKAVPTLEQIHRVLEVMPHGSALERRDRALVAFAALSGARDGALASLRLKHVDLADQSVMQDARDVRTKFSKSFRTWFFPIGGPASEIVTEWIAYLRGDLLWCDEDPLFPKTRIEVGANRQFEAVGLERKCWSSADPIRKIFRRAFAEAGLPYFNPHTIRDLLAQLGERCCRSPEEFKAWSQNLGHEQVLTTFRSYGEVAAHRQGEIIRGLRPSGDIDPLADPELRAALRRFANRATA